MRREEEIREKRKYYELERKYYELKRKYYNSLAKNLTLSLESNEITVYDLEEWGVKQKLLEFLNK